MENLIRFRGNPDQCRKLLKETRITTEAPGTILRDVEVLLDAIGTKGIATKSKNGNLPTDYLAQLNERMSDPIEIELKRPLLRNYPNLAGVFLLLRTMDLVVIRGRRTCVDSSQLKRWRSLGPAERYFALLETWLAHADPRLLDQGADNPMIANNLLEFMLFLG
ncbi:MAG: hypothetical protein ACLFS4_07200, partial [Opitutales bacterium]